MQGMYSMRSPAVKRLMKEAHELREPTEQYHAQPLEDNLFEWHFTIRGPEDTEFAGGIFHGRIVLPPDYPMKPPSIIILTPNGRFEVNKKICLSISGHHPESWQPSWSIRTALLAIIGFMPTHGAGAIGSLDYNKEERQKLSTKSQEWKCPTCGRLNHLLKPVTEESQKTKEEAKQLAQQINFAAEKKPEQNGTNGETSPTPPTPVSQAPTTSASSSQSSNTQQPTGGHPFNAQFNQQFQFNSQFPQFFRPPFMMPMPRTANQNSQSPYVSRFPPPPPMLPMMYPGFFPTQMPQMVPPTTANNTSMFPGPSGSVSSTSAPNISSQSTSALNISSPSSNVQSPSSVASSSVSQATPTATGSVSSAGGVASTESRIPTPPSTTTTTTTTTSGTGDDSQRPGSDEWPTETGVRQRQTLGQNTGQQGSTNQNTEQRPAERPVQPPLRQWGTQSVPSQTEQNNGRFSLVLMIILSFAIGLLLIRRFILSRSWKFYYGL